jgi:hypothetical protein
MLPIIGAIASAVGGIFKSWMEVRKVKAEGSIKIAAAKVEASVKREEALGQMDVLAMSDMRFSWKDELLTIWTLAVVSMCFIPWTQPYVMDGFKFLEANTPDWFGWCFTGMYVAVFGLRTYKGWNK